MKILFQNPTYGSGIEQVGYVFLLLLKKLGHELDLWNTQCANEQELKISGIIGDYDVVVLNAAQKESFDRMIKQPADNIFNISHDGTALPPFCKQLSLNYLHQYKFLGVQNGGSGEGVLFPVTYPYAHKKTEFSEDRPYKFGSVGRWCKEKFHPDVKKFMEENGIKLDYVITNRVDEGYSPDSIAKVGFRDANVGQIEEYFRKTKYLLVPSTTECITLVAGEALANGCIPVTLESSGKEHEQFVNCITADSVQKFNEIVAGLDANGLDAKGINRRRAFEFTNKMWSIEKSLEELGTIFGAGKKGIVRVFSDDNAINGPGFRKTLPYINATIITGETAE